MFGSKDSLNQLFIASLIGIELAQKQALKEGANTNISNLGINIPTIKKHKVWQITASRQTS
mgnify:CR=1 FL=1